MQGLTDFLEALDQGGTAAAKLISTYSTAFIPYASGLKSIARLKDTYQRRKESKFFRMSLADRTVLMMKENAEAVLPWTAGHLRPARYWDGELSTESTGWLGIYNAVSPIRISKAKKTYDRANDELIKNHVTVSF